MTFNYTAPALSGSAALAAAATGGRGAWTASGAPAGAAAVVANALVAHAQDFTSGAVQGGIALVANSGIRAASSTGLAAGGTLAAKASVIDAASVGITASGSLSSTTPATTGSQTFLDGSANGPVQKQWSSLPLGAVGDYIGCTTMFEASVQIEGVFGSGGAVVIEGSNDGQTAETLKDSTGIAMHITSRGLYQIGTLPAQFRPNVTSGDGTTALTITAVLRPQSMG